MNRLGYQNGRAAGTDYSNLNLDGLSADLSVHEQRVLALTRAHMSMLQSTEDVGDEVLLEFTPVVGQ